MDLDPQALIDTGVTLKWLLTIAWLLPLLGFVVELIWGGWFWGRHSKNAAYLAVVCIVTGFVCSFAALMTWGGATKWSALQDHGHGSTHADAHSGAAHAEVGGQGDFESPHAAGTGTGHDKPNAAHHEDGEKKAEPAKNADAAKKDVHPPAKPAAAPHPTEDHHHANR